MTISRAEVVNGGSFSRQSVLSECERLDYAARNSYLARLGRSVDNSNDISAAAEALGKGSVYERLMALQISSGARNFKPAFKALTDPSRQLQRRAVHMIACSASDKDIKVHAGGMSVEIKDRLIRHLRRARRCGPIDHILSLLASEAPARYTQLVAYGSGDYVQAHASKVLDGFTEPDWRKLAMMHPAFAVETVTARLAEASYDAAYFHHLNAMINGLDKLGYTGRSLVPILEAVGEQDKLSSLRSWAAIAKRHPSEILELALSEKTTPPATMIRWKAIVSKLSIGQLVASLRLSDFRNGYQYSYNFWTCKDLPHHRALELWEALGRPDKWQLTDDALRIMPQEQRFDRIRRRLSEDAGEAKQDQDDRVAFAALLPWDEAMTYNADGIKSRDIEVRRLRLKLQIQNACLQQESTGPALKLMIRHRNEQDNVWSAVLKGLIHWPCKSWDAPNRLLLEEIIDLLIDSSTASESTLKSLALVVSKIGLYQPAWAVKQGVRIFSRDAKAIPRKTPFLEVKTLEVTQAMVDHAQSQLAAWSRPSTYEHILRLVVWLGPSVKTASSIKKILVKIVTDSRDTADANTALELHGKLYPEENLQLVQALLKADSTYTELRFIASIAQEQRQSLLHYFLTPALPNGRFSLEETHREPSLSLYLNRWTLAQQDKYAELLLDEINVYRSDLSRIPGYIGTLSRLAFSQKAADGVKNLAAGDLALTRDPAVRDLARLDSDQGLDTLLEALTDHRGRLAIFAVRSYFHKLDSEQALQLFANLRSPSITVQKEVIRLVGEIGTPQACDVLLRIANGDTPHDDLMIPLVTRLWKFVDERPTEISAFLDQAAQHKEKDIAKRTFESHPEELSDVGGPLLLSLLRRGLSHPAEYVVTSALSKIESRSLKQLDFGDDILQTIISKVRSTTASVAIQKKASSVLMNRFIVKRPDAILQLLSDIRLDHARFAQVFSDILCSHTIHEDAANICPKIIGILRSDPMYNRFQIQLITVLPVPDIIFGHFLDLLATVHADDLQQAISCIKNSMNHGKLTRKIDLTAFERKLREHESANCRRLGFAVLDGLAKRGNTGWVRHTEDWGDGRAELLEVYRNDPSPLVRDAATWTFIPKE